MSSSLISAKTVVEGLLKDAPCSPVQATGKAFAPTNIALCKYWGKRDNVLNLPITSSLSLSLGTFGATTTVSEWVGPEDCVVVNHQEITLDSLLYGQFKERLIHFLNLLRPNPQTRYRVETEVNIPIAAGLASSACGFAALVLALNQLYGWDLPLRSLSILARLGSGSACRSLWPGFVKWFRGEEDDGMDSYGIPLAKTWPGLCMGLLLIDAQQKPLSSRLAMQRTRETSPFYNQWPQKVSRDLNALLIAIETQDFAFLGETAESNAQTLHALMMSATPSIVYTLPETLSAMRSVWDCRSSGLPIYFTQDAGPNLKLLFLERDLEKVRERFPEVVVISPFGSEHVVLVDSYDKVIGTEEKIKAHELGLLHRAFSVFIYRKTDQGVEFLLQKRHADKYHCGGLWTNACCSHPRLDEPVVLAGQRRLKEEMSLDIPLKSVGSFIYQAQFDNGLTEHEFDYVLLGEYKRPDPIRPDPQEVDDHRWVLISMLQGELKQSTHGYTPWFKPAFDLAVEAVWAVS